MPTEQTSDRSVSRIRFVLRLAVALIALATGLYAAPAAAEVLIRWDEAEVPSAASLGISTLVIPAEDGAAVRSAVARGYRVYLEVAARALAAFVPPSDGFAGVVVRGQASAQQLALLRSRLGRRGRVITLDERGKWPHIRSNWVTRNRDVLQVSNRSAQPWIETNAALMRIVGAARQSPLTQASAGEPVSVFFSYAWQSETQSALDDGPEPDDYLVAIAEAGSFGGDLLLPLHQRFEKELLLGLPQAREAWQRIQRYLTFYSWELPSRYAPTANIGVATANPVAWFEVMNLLSRYNLPFQLISPVRLSAAIALDVVIALDPPTAAQYQVLEAFARKGGTVVLGVTTTSASRSASSGPWASLPPLLSSEERVTYEVGAGRVIEVRNGIANPDKFALEIREVLGPARRPIDIWNGITVVAAPFRDPDGGRMLVTVLNYAHQPLPVQLRIAGTFSLVQYESPEELPTLLPYQQRDGFTEIVVPALRTGGRVFLSNGP